MDQVITRRFRHEKEGDETFASRPDLLLIDGGEAHAAVALQALTRYGPVSYTHLDVYKRQGWGRGKVPFGRK